MRTGRDVPAHAEGQDALGGAQDEAANLARGLVDRELAEDAFAQRLRAAMDGDTPACAAVKLGLSRRVVARAWRTGEANARLLREICRVYGVDGHWLLTGEGERRRASIAPPAPAAPGPRSSLSEDLLVEVSTRLASLLAELDQFRSRHEGR